MKICGNPAEFFQNILIFKKTSLRLWDFWEILTLGLRYPNVRLTLQNRKEKIRIDKNR